MSFIAWLADFPRRLRRRLNTLIVVPQLARAGSGVSLGAGFRVNHPEFVHIGDGVEINDFCWISLLLVNSERGAIALTCRPKVSIGDRTYVGRFATLACMDSIEIGNDVLISDRVFIGDCNHGSTRTDLPIKDQYLTSPGKVVIGDGAWLGIGVSILPNVRIGRNAVIGANSVVCEDVADFHVAAGVPARILRRLDAGTPGGH